MVLLLKCKLVRIGRINKNEFATLGLNSVFIHASIFSPAYLIPVQGGTWAYPSCHRATGQVNALLCCTEGQTTIHIPA